MNPEKNMTKNAGPSAEIDKGEVEITGLATWTQGEKSLKQPTLAAARTASQEAGHDG